MIQIDSETARQHAAYKAARARINGAARKLVMPAPQPVQYAAPAEDKVAPPKSKFWFWPVIDDSDQALVPTARTIQNIVAARYSVTRNDLISSRRTADVVRPRQVAMFLMKEMTPSSLPMIGRAFGGRDHTTALHAVRKIEALLAVDMGLQAMVETIRRDIAPEAS